VSTLIIYIDERMILWAPMEHDRSEQAVLDMDGEFEQIQAYTEDAKLYKDIGIDLAKGSASFSRWANALDAGDLWKAAKTINRSSTVAKRREAGLHGAQ
jgi:hypothetical protein